MPAPSSGRKAGMAQAALPCSTVGSPRRSTGSSRIARMSIRRTPSVAATCATTWDLPTPGAPQRKAGFRIRVSSCREVETSDGFMGASMTGHRGASLPGCLPAAASPRPSHFYGASGDRRDHQTALRCLDRAVRFGAMAALDDSPRPGKAPEITDEARAWLVPLACQKARDLGYPHELWTTRLLARHARDNAVAAGHPCMASIVQGTVCKILARHEVKPHKVRYYLERRAEDFEAKMADVLCVYREVAILRKAKPATRTSRFISYDEKPGIQAIGNTAPDLPPQPGSQPTFARDHEYQRHGTLSL